MNLDGETRTRMREDEKRCKENVRTRPQPRNQCEKSTRKAKDYMPVRGELKRG